MSDERQRRRAQRAAIEALALSQSEGGKELDTILREVTESVARCLDVERVSVWRFSEERDALVCVVLYELSKSAHECGSVLEKDDYPAYFASLSAQRALVADDAHVHEATREFSDDYLSPNSITSMLDAPIRVDGGLYGVVCHEHVGKPRTWAEDEVDFAGSVADLVALAVTTDRLRQSEELLQLALDASDVGTFIWYPVRDEVIWDERTHRIFDWPAEMFTGRLVDFVERLHPKDRPMVEAEIQKSIDSGDPYRMEMRIVDREGETRFIEGRGQPFFQPDGEIDHFSGTCFDVTERRAMERQAYETQKLGSLGLLAGGIAHDFNNLLVGVLGNASLVLLDQVASPTARQALEGIRAAATQAGDLCRQLLAYSGQGSVVVEPVDLNVLIAQTTGLVAASIKKGVNVRTNLSSGAPHVEADATQLRQVLMNLIINASEAMTSSGTVTVATRSVQVGDDVDWPAADDLSVGEHLLLSVVDDGPGIPAEVLGQIFDPFFSTKATGRGLGLAAVLGIIRSHRGVVRVSSELSQGTRFDILLPATEHRAEPASPPPQTPVPAEDRPVALLVDDEPLVLNVGKAVLERFGFEVDAFRKASDALARFAEAPGRYRVAILDLTLAGSDGLALARDLRQIRGDLPVLIASGFARESVGAGLASLGRAHFLQKPYTADALMTAVESVVDATD